MNDDEPPPNLPDGCPVLDGESCPHEKKNRRRASDRLPASAARITLAILGLIGAGGGGWMVREKVSADTTVHAAVVDQSARDAAQQASQGVALLRAEVTGDIKVMRQQQEQILESLRELRDEARRRGR